VRSAADSKFYSMPEFWTFLADLVKKLPSAAEYPDQAEDQNDIGWEGLDRCPSTSSSASDADVANLDDLKAFDLLDD
jgi:hypothetical protein